MEYKRILTEIDSVMKRTNPADVDKFVNALAHSYRVYVSGEGRSGLVVKAFAMRLVHLHRRCFVVGETVTPALRKGDILLVVSGSGETRSVVETAESAKNLGGIVLCVTAQTQSNLSKYCDISVVLPTKVMKKTLKSFELRELEGEAMEPPLGSLFEVSCMIFFEVVVMELMKKLGIGEKQMYKVHQNL